MEQAQYQGRVVKLDRGFPLVALELCGSRQASWTDDALVRCEHAASLVKERSERATVGDVVDLALPEEHSKGIIVRIHPRSRVFVRKDPTERAAPQLLAANFDCVMVVQSLVDVQFKRLERELVLAHETGARVVLVLTKADLVSSEQEAAQICLQLQAFVGDAVAVCPVSRDDPVSIEVIRAHIAPGTTAILIGKSGVGKSTLVNALVGKDARRTGAVRAFDGKGRHTTVSRQMMPIPNGGFVVDMPGVRGLGLWDADLGMSKAFKDIENLAAQCKFRDCTHTSEPGCAVQAALRSGVLSEQRFSSYQELHCELQQLELRREETRRLHGEKHQKRKRK